MDEDQLTITLTGKEEFIPVASFLSVVDDLLAILRDVDSSISGRRATSQEWRIYAVSLNSPLSFTILGEDKRETLAACVRGLRQIESSSDRIPEFFREETLERASNLVSTLNDGIGRIVISNISERALVPSLQLAYHVSRLLPKEHEEFGSFEGILETLSVHEKYSFAIWDFVTGHRVKCLFPDDMLDEAHSDFNERVIVTGTIRYSRKGKPLHVNVIKMRQLPHQTQLPQAKDLEGLIIETSHDWETV